MGDIFDFCKRGDLQSIRSIKGHFDINATDKKDKYTPLMWAAKGGHCDVVQYLIKDCKEIELDKKGGWNESTAIMKAVESDHLEVIQVLAESGADIDLSNDFKSTALMLAAERGHKAIVKYLVERKAYLDSQNELGYTAMILAAENGHAEILHCLCKGGANTAVQNQFGKTAIIMAAEMNHIECVRVLLEANANKDHRSKRGMTALMLATVKGNRDIVQLLLENRALVNLQNNDGESALINSFYPKDISLTKMLLAYEADMTLKDKHGCTPLMIAARNGRLDVVELFLSDLSSGHKADVNVRSNDGSTAVHFASMKGHLSVILTLIDHGSDMKKSNYNGLTALDLLAKYYIGGTETQFKYFVKNIGTHTELLEMLPEILPKLQSPNAYLNHCFSDLLLALKNAKDLDIVVGLVYLAVGIRLAIKSHPLEAVDLYDRLNTANKMLLECMASDGLDEEENVSLVFQDHAMRMREFKMKSSPKLTKARGFMEGPLFLCVKHKLLPILGTRQVSIHVDKVFWGSIKDKAKKQIFTVWDFFQMRSNGVYWRTCPAANFFLEGISKLIMLALVGILVIAVYDPNVYQPGDGKYLENFLLLMLIGHLLHELGELQDNDWIVADYLAEIWNYLDLLSLALLSGWAALQWQNDIYTSIASPLGLDHLDPTCYEHCNSTAIPSTAFTTAEFLKNTLSAVGIIRPTSSGENSLILPFFNAKACLIMSAIPMSFALLRYLSTFRGLGQLVLMTFAMMKDLGKFVIVFTTSVLGFGIAFRGLFPSLGAFTSVPRTILTLYDAALGQHDFSIFFDDPNHHVGVVLYVVYISLTMVVLLNLVIARFSATHDKINERSLQIWSMMKARYVQDFLLIEERSAFSMLPPPLNLISIALIPLHHAVLAIAKLMNEGDGEPRTAYEVLQMQINSAVDYTQELYDYWSEFFITSTASLNKCIIYFQQVNKEGLKAYTLLSISVQVSDLFMRVFSELQSCFRDPKRVLKVLKDVIDWFNAPFKSFLSWFKPDNSARIHSDNDISRRPYTVISVCGTASDILMSMVTLIPCAFYEIYLCLKDIKAQASSIRTYYVCFTLTVVMYPFVLVAYIITLLIEIARVRSVLEVDEKGEMSLKYEEPEVFARKNSKPLKVDGRTSHTTLNVKIIRADFIRKDYTLFSRPSLYAVVQIGAQELVTKMVESMEMNPNWFEEKDFILIFRDSSTTMDKITLTVYDNYHRVVGTTVVSIERWVANGRFEGPLPLFLNDQKTGVINVVVKVMPSGKKRIEKQSSVLAVRNEPAEKDDHPKHRLNVTQLKRVVVAAQNAKDKVKHNKDDGDHTTLPPLFKDQSRSESTLEPEWPTIFTDEDRERIFHGVKENSSNFAKNPYAFEMYMEIKNQLEELEAKLDKKERQKKRDDADLFSQFRKRLDSLEEGWKIGLDKALLDYFEKYFNTRTPSISRLPTMMDMDPVEGLDSLSRSRSVSRTTTDDNGFGVANNINNNSPWDIIS